MAEFTDTDGRALLDIAEATLRARLTGQPAPAIDLASLPPALRAGRPAFVTLHVAGALNGCIGDLAGAAPLAESIVRLAQRSAFDDPRLPQLRVGDLDRLEIEISLLSAPVPVPARTRSELFDHLEPDRHGLILTSGRHRALFLPAVWKQLPDRDDFVDRLLVKAGLRPQTWPADLRAEVFTTTTFERRLDPRPRPERALRHE